MLDAYIIDRIRREREQQRKESGIPLRIERDPPPPPAPPPVHTPGGPSDDEDDGNGTVVDYRL